MTLSRGPQGKLSFDTVALRIAIVTKAYTINGRKYLDCRSPGGEIGAWTQVPMMSLGGGGPSIAYHDPVSAAQDDAVSIELTQGAQAVLLFPRKTLMPYCVGVLQHLGSGVLEDVTPEAVTADEKDPRVYSADLLRRNGGTDLVIDGNGMVMFNLKEAVTSGFQIQFNDSGHFRVSRDGAATERVPLSQPVIDKFNEIKTHLDDLAVALGSATAGSDKLVITLPSSIGAAGDEMKAATIHIPSDSE